MIYLIPLPFLIELIGDWYLIKKGKKDIPLWVRIAMIAIVSHTIRFEGGDLQVIILVKHALLATAPFAFFDNILAWMRGKRGLDYQGQSKWYDRVFIAWLTKKLTPKGVLIARGVLCLVLVILGLT